MIYTSKYLTNEKELLEQFGFDGETSFITKIDWDAKTGFIEVLVKSVTENDNMNGYEGNRNFSNKID